ncbi:hypothetical protein ACMHYJ_02550 [Castellaniella hirudinis]|uniref:hypothetical protein n=1 Tax=Castellaniella hirudinis TaxID=1144617 RepID=UPI0039C1BB0D
MHFVAQGDLVLKSLFVLLAIMLFVSAYLTLLKAVSLIFRFVQARRFLIGLAEAGSWRQLEALVGRLAGDGVWPRLAQRVMAGLKPPPGAGRPSGGPAGDVLAQRLIAREIAAQTLDLRRGLEVLVAIAWAAPVVGGAAVGWAGLGPTPLDPALGGATALLFLGLAVAGATLLACLGLRVAGRLYLAQFTLFQQLLAPILRQGRSDSVRGVRSPSGFHQAEILSINII